MYLHITFTQVNSLDLVNSMVLFFNHLVSWIVVCLFLNGFLVIAVRDRTISPAELQGILGMMAYDQRTGGGARGLSSYFPAGFNPRGSRQVQY